MASIHGADLGGGFDAAIAQAFAHVLLFLLALVLRALVPERMGVMHLAIVRDPVDTTLRGALGYVVTGISIVALAITVLGIPASLLLMLLLPLATYVGLAAAAAVIGAALPLEGLGGKPVRQLAAGVGALFVASLVPWLGGLLVAVAACVGYGALLRTRFRAEPPPELLLRGEPIDAGPYRSSAL